MTVSAIRQAFENAVKAASSGFATAWPNASFDPINGEPYQEVAILFAEPENPTFGDSFYRQRGYLQVSLRYPVNKGAGDILERADLLRDTFHRGLSLTAGGVTAVVEKTPEIGAGSYEGDRYVINVFVRFFANIFQS